MNKQPILAVRSYANPYDRAYDLFKNTQNFKNDMWNTSVRNGDINLYLTLLDNTKATKFREEFYNPQYYDYDTMMFDMAKENYDNTEASLSQREVISYDINGKEIKTKTEEEYTDKQWAEIQLNKMYDIRRKEIQAQVEQARKDNMGWLEKTGHTILATGGELLEGIVTGITGFADYIAANFYAMYKGVAEGQNFADAFTEYFGKGLTALEKDTLRKSLDEYEAKYSYIRNIDGSYTDIGKYLGGAANSIGMMIPSIVMNVVAPGSGSVLFYTSMYGNRMYELETNKLTKGSPSLLKITNSFVSSVAEATIEWGLGKILGSTVGNKLLGINGNFNIGDIKRLGANVLFKSAAQEGLEEVIQDFSTGLVNTFSSAIYAGYGNQGIGGKEGVTFQTLIDSFIMGVGTSLILSGVASATNSIKTSAEGRVEAKIQKGLADGSLIENADGTIVDKNGNKVANSKYITPRIEVDGKLEKVSGLTRFVYNDLVQGFQEAISKLQEGKGNIKLAKEVFTAFNQLASLYKSFGDERLAKAKSLLNMYEENKNSKFVNNKTVSAYMISEFNDMVNNAPERVNKKLAEEGAKLLEKTNKQLEENEVKNITAVATKTDTIVKENKTKKSKVNKNKLSDITKDYDWVFITDGKEAFEVDKNKIFIPESWLANYQKTEIYEFIQQNEIIKNIRSYPGFTSLLEFIDKTFTDLTGTKITNKNKDEALINFLFNEKFYQYVLFSNLDMFSKLGKNGLIDFKNIIFKLHTVVSELANKAKTDINKSLIKKLQKEMFTAQRKPTIKAIVHWNIDPQAVGADNILTKEDRELVQKAQALKKSTTVQAVLGKQVSQAFIRRHQKVIDKAERNIREYKDKKLDPDKDILRDTLIVNGLKDNASKIDRLKAYILLEDTYLIEKGVNNNSLITLYADAFTMNGSKADIELYNDVVDYCVNKYGATPSQILLNFQEWEEIPSFIDKKLRSEIDIYSVSYDEFLELAKLEFQKDLQNHLGNKYVFDSDYRYYNKVYKSVDIDTLLKRYIKTEYDFYQCFIHNNVKENDSIGEYYEIKINDLINFNKIAVPKSININDYKVRIYTKTNKQLPKSNTLVKNELRPKLSDNSPGFFYKNTIYIYAKYGYMFSTFTHELNHLFQRMFDMKKGGDKNTLSNKYVKYIEDNFKDVLSILPYDAKYLGYLLLEGELFARYTGQIDKINEIALGLVEGLEDNSTQLNNFVKNELRPEVSNKAIENIGLNHMISTFDNMQLITDELSEGIKTHVRDTYHSALTNKSTYELVNDLTREDLSILDKISLNLDNIIKNPKKYLKENILSRFLKSNRDINNEGDVYYFLKNYLEETYGDISIDRNAFTNTYVFVNDSAFNDLLKSDISKKLNDNKDLIENYKNKTVKLSDIYNQSELVKLKIPDNIEISFGDEYSNEFIVDDEHQDGIIHINTSYVDTNDKLIIAINHEFRHLLQQYYHFEQGFTIDFLLTKEQLKDIKEHVPEIFTDESNLQEAENILKGDDDKKEEKENSQKTKNILKGDDNKKVISLEEKENLIGRMFIYYMTGGEQNAYGIKANFLMNKPCYVRYDGGNPTIFMPWYDGTNGKYKTKFIANRAVTPTRKRPVYKKKLVDMSERSTSRYFSNAKAKGTLLEKFVKPGKQNEMDLLLQDFLIALTPKYKEIDIPKELVYQIEKGELNATMLYNWFRSTDNINDELFKIINDTMFKNSYIKNSEQLNKLIDVDMANYFGVIITLLNEGISLEEFEIEYKQRSKFKDLIIDNLQTEIDRLLANQEYAEKIEANKLKFYKYTIEGEKKNGAKYKISHDLDNVSKESRNYIRLYAMRYFDGTLNSLFLMANTYKAALLKDKQLNAGKETSMQRVIHGKHDGETEQGDTLSEEDDITDVVYADIIRTFNLSDNNNIYKLFDELDYVKKYAQQRINNIPIDEKKTLIYDQQMLKHEKSGSIQKLANELVEDYRKEKEHEAKIGLTHFDEIQDDIEEYSSEAYKTARYKIGEMVRRKLDSCTNDKINELYEKLVLKDMTGIDTTNIITEKTNIISPNRKQLYYKISRLATKLKSLVAPKDWKKLPDTIKNLFEAKTKKGEVSKKPTYVQQVLKPEITKVGYANKKTGPADVSKLIEVVKLFENEIDKIELTRALAEDNKKRSDIIVKRIERRTEKINLETSQSTKLKDKKFETEIKVKAQKGKTEYHIYSTTPMPDIVKNIFDTSFNSMRNTLVQFASRDEDGRLYTKDSEEFKSAQKHEVANWDAFYEANYKTLNNLTRPQVIEIIEYIVKSNPISLGEASGKLEAFKIFLLGYILDGARSGIWEMSQSDIDQIEKYYEQLASTAGSTLAAVNQMIKVVNPVKQIKQLMLDKYNVSPEQIDNLSDDLDKLQAAKTEQDKKAAYEKISKTIKDITKTIAENQEKRSVWERIKSFRFMSMLSGPLTWLRNFVSNHIVTKFNKASDALASFVFRKKDFRKGQWNLASTETSDEVVKFINENIKNSPLLDDMYDASTKYDQRAKVSKKQKELFITLVTNSIESKYAAEHRFNSDALNKVSNFVSKMISDKKFIKGAALKYLGKILTIENKAGRVKLDQGLSTDVLNLFADAVILASQDYMHKRSFFADMLDALRSSDNFGSKAAYEVITTWQPFLNSGWNWFTALLDYTPIGIGKGIYQMLKLEKSINKMDEKRAKGHLTPDSRVAEYLARRSIGSGILGAILTAVGFLLTSCGIVKIEENDDEFRLKVGDISVDISDVFGTSTLLCGMAMGQMGSKSFADILKTMTTETTNGFILIDILDRYQYSYQTDGSLGILLLETENFLKSFIPNIYQQFVRASKNQKVKYGKGFLGLLTRTANAFVPFVSIGEKVINIYTGEPQAKYSLPFLGEYLKGGALFGVKLFTDVITEEERFAQSYGVNKTALDGKLTVNGIEYKINNSYSLNLKYGELNKKALAQLPNSKTTYKVQMPDGSYKYLKFSNMSDKQKKLIIERVMEANAKIAKIYQWTNEGHKYYASNEEFNSLKKLGITTNVYRGDKGFVE